MVVNQIKNYMKLNTRHTLSVGIMELILDPKYVVTHDSGGLFLSDFKVF